MPIGRIDAPSFLAPPKIHNARSESGVLFDCIGLGSVNNDLARFRIIPYESDWERSLTETVGNGGQCATAILANVAVPGTRNQQVPDSRRW